jgi:biopolymer transport protein ExbD
MLRLRRKLRRHKSGEPHMDLIPLVDVVFQMLFFFMIAMTVMSQVKSRSVAMANVVGGETKGEMGGGGGKGHFLVVDGTGQVVIDDQPVAKDDLDAKLKAIAAEDGASLHVGLEQQGSGDRGPAVFDLIQRVGAAGIPNITFTQMEGLGASPDPKAAP